jgi:quinol monooxygenase YgiN
MSQLRVLHQLRTPGDGVARLSQHAADLRAVDGVIEADAYRHITDPAQAAVVELWESQAAFAVHWREVLAGRRSGPLHTGTGPAFADSTEFYERQSFFPQDGAWTSMSYAEQAPVVMWPARGPVRILAQLAVPAPEQAVPAFRLDAEATLCEPGCAQYGWFQGTEHEQDMLLLELWDDQILYDRHWNLRIRTGNATDKAPEGARGGGACGIEFYRHQPFIHLYDRWLPSDAAERSDTVVWPN